MGRCRSYTAVTVLRTGNDSTSASTRFISPTEYYFTAKRLIPRVRYSFEYPFVRICLPSFQCESPVQDALLPSVTISCARSLRRSTARLSPSMASPHGRSVPVRAQLHCVIGHYDIFRYTVLVWLPYKLTCTMSAVNDQSSHHGVGPTLANRQSHTADKEYSRRVILLRQ